MTLRQSLSAVPTGMWLMLSDTSAGRRLMSGIARAGVRSDGLVRAVYEDGQEREKLASESLLERNADDLTLLVIASEFTP